MAHRCNLLIALLTVLAFILNLGNAYAQPAPTIPWLPSPTPVPTGIPVPTVSDEELPLGEVYDYLATAAVNVNGLPEDISEPGGVPILPNDDGRQLFGYAKWLWSGNSTQELLGPTLAPLVISIQVWVTATIIIVAVWFTIKLVRSILTDIVLRLFFKMVLRLVGLG